MNSHQGNIGADGHNSGTIILNKKQVNAPPLLPLRFIKMTSVDGPWGVISSEKMQSCPESNVLLGFWICLSARGLCLYQSDGGLSLACPFLSCILVRRADVCVCVC